jgi:valyl-tRNA synthetase
LIDLTLEHPLFPQRHIPVSVYNEITTAYGTGINAVNPGHDLDSLAIASNYNLAKDGYVDNQGRL